MTPSVVITVILAVAILVGLWWWFATQEPFDEPDDRPPVVVSNGSSVDVEVRKVEEDEKTKPGQAKKRHTGRWKQEGKLEPDGTGRYKHSPDKSVTLKRLQINLHGSDDDAAYDLVEGQALKLKLSTGGTMTFAVEAGDLTFTNGGETLVRKGKHHLKIEGQTRVEQVSLDGGTRSWPLDGQGWVEVRSRH